MDSAEFHLYCLAKNLYFTDYEVGYRPAKALCTERRLGAPSHREDGPPVVAADIQTLFDDQYHRAV